MLRSVLAAAVAVGFVSGAIAGNGPPGSISIADWMRMQKQINLLVKPCLRWAHLTRSEGGAQVRLRIYARPDGTLAKPPEIIQAPNAREGQLAVAAIERCITRRTPLPYERRLYPAWQSFVLRTPRAAEPQ